VTIARVWEPVLLREVEVIEDVSRMTVTLAEMVELEAGVDWAETESMREA
jgi:hypothetical protein